MDRQSRKGFTVAELITVTAIVGILASVALPLARFGLRRQKEAELMQHLKKITWAIDQYYDLRTKGVIKDHLPWARDRIRRH